MYTSILDCYLTYSHKPTDLIEQDRYLESPFLLRAVRCLLALLNTCDWVSLRISVYTFLQVCPNYTACFDVPQLPLMKDINRKKSSKTNRGLDRPFFFRKMFTDRLSVICWLSSKVQRSKEKYDLSRFPSHLVSHSIIPSAPYDTWDMSSDEKRTLMRLFLASTIILNPWGVTAIRLLLQSLATVHQTA